ncbi:hypothetical protein JXA85_06440 [Candidatus Woesearchaeota archaeon]|nr:hypothetical protein [Candidatus Woesearchaeota archaeon]
MKRLILGVLFLVATCGVAFGDTPILGTGLNISLNTEDFEPLVFLNTQGCSVYHNKANGGAELIERIENYAFEGERIVCEILVIDKNGIEKVKDVYMTASDDETPTAQDIEAECDEIGISGYNGSMFNARIDEEVIIDLDDEIMSVYKCNLSVETYVSMHGEFWISAVAEDLEGQLGWAAEQQHWFLNPEIAIETSGNINFGTVRPGTIGYSTPVTVENAAESGSGVMLNMLISGKDFYDPAHSGAKCPDTNALDLENFGYYASNAGHHTMAGYAPRENTLIDHEGYYWIPQETGNKSGREEIIEGTTMVNGYWVGNVLSPGGDMTIIFAIALPEPCNGDFNSGSIYLWAEAV